MTLFEDDSAGHALTWAGGATLRKNPATGEITTHCSCGETAEYDPATDTVFCPRKRQEAA